MAHPSPAVERNARLRCLEWQLAVLAPALTLLRQRRAQHVAAKPFQLRSVSAIDDLLRVQVNAGCCKCAVRVPGGSSGPQCRSFRPRLDSLPRTNPTRVLISLAHSMGLEDMETFGAGDYAADGPLAGLT